MMGLHQRIPTLPFLRKGGAYQDAQQVRALLVGEVWGRHAPKYTGGAGRGPERRRFRSYVIGLGDEKGEALAAWPSGTNMTSAGFFQDVACLSG